MALEIRKSADPVLANIPIIAVSAHSLKEGVRRSMECGRNAHLPKPIGIEKIMRQIDALPPKAHGIFTFPAPPNTAAKKAYHGMICPAIRLFCTAEAWEPLNQSPRTSWRFNLSFS